MAGEREVALGRAALESGEWAEAAAAFEGALAQGETADALDGLGRALWWQERHADGLDLRARAYTAYLAAHRWDEAAIVAAWLAREHRTLFRNDAVGAGWVARARRAAARAPDTSAAGWVLLTEAEAAADPALAAEGASAAVGIAQVHNDADLEIAALARKGVVEVATGRVEQGFDSLDEAMAAATAGEARDPQSVGDACCALMEAAELTGDSERVTLWADAVQRYRNTYRDGRLTAVGAGGILSAFCGACCGGIYLVTGRLDDAEAELIRSIAALEANGLASRCVHPVTQLAEVRVVQGRLQEARDLLAGYADLPESVRPLAVLDLASGEALLARARLRTAIDSLAQQELRALPLWVTLVDAELACGDVDGATAAAAAVARIAGLTGSVRHDGEGLFARGKVAAATNDPAAVNLLSGAARRLSQASLALLACRARAALARTLAGVDRAAAIAEARGVLAAFERLGATADADETSAFLRSLGVRGRTGSKEVGKLTKRELQVLRLLSEGLSNAEIAQRLFISVKTAGHHVSNVLAKLQLRSRTEAAAFAALNLPAEPVGK